MLPQLADGGWIPSPMNDSADSIRIAVPTPNVMFTRTLGNRCGNAWRVRSAQGPRAQRARGLDERLLANGQQLGAHQARESHPRRGADRDHEARDAGAEQRERRDDEEDRGDGHHGVGEPHDQRVDPPAPEAREGA